MPLAWYLSRDIPVLRQQEALELEPTLYLAVVIDLFSRRVVGWNMGSRMKADLVCDALRMAIWQRKPAAGLIVRLTICQQDLQAASESVQLYWKYEQNR